MTYPHRCLFAAVAALVTAATVFLYGVWVGHLIDLRAVGEYCPGGSSTDSVSQRWFPPQQTCHFSDGTSRDLVPGFVAPVLLLAPVVAVLCLVRAVRGFRRAVPAAIG